MTVIGVPGQETDVRAIGEAYWRGGQSERKRPEREEEARARGRGQSERKRPEREEEAGARGRGRSERKRPEREEKTKAEGSHQDQSKRPEREVIVAKGRCRSDSEILGREEDA